MSDRFKFRAWHIADKVMVYFDKDDHYQLSQLFHLMHGTHSEDGIVEQCTGLRDKNGTLVYEGDFVRAGRAERLTHIMYDDCGFRHNLVGSNHASLIGDLWCELYNPEVIGNIHENPELLEA